MRARDEIAKEAWREIIGFSDGEIVSLLVDSRLEVERLKEEIKDLQQALKDERAGFRDKPTLDEEGAQQTL